MVTVIGSLYAGCNYCDATKRKAFKSFLEEYQQDEFVRHFLKLHFTNGEYFMHISYLGNHAGKSVDNIVSFFKDYLPSILGQDSFGVLYVYDDEGGRLIDEFEFYVLRKGIVHQEKDTHLSPFSSMVSPEGISQF